MNNSRKIDKIRPETLLQLVKVVLDASPDFKYINGTQPFLMSFTGKEYYVYIKNVSSAYFEDRDKTTRAQLPIKPEFEEIKTSPLPFIFLGYDADNDVLICWNFHVAKERLNAANSVSFYSRTFFQEEVRPGEFLRKTLKNGDQPVLFKRRDIVQFFSRIDTFFTVDVDYTTKLGTSDISEFNYQKEECGDVNNSGKVCILSSDTSENGEIPDACCGKLLRITDPKILTILKPLIESNRNLSAAQEVGKYYAELYPKMTLVDWMNLVKSIDSTDNVNLTSQTDAIISSMPQEGKKKKLHILRVKFPNGEVVQERVVAKTLLKALEYAGIDRVRRLGIVINGVNLISDTIVPKYAPNQKSVGNGLYAMTCCDTETKYKIIKQISETFSLNLEIEKVDI